jgi:hypothetical protein
MSLASKTRVTLSSVGARRLLCALAKAMNRRRRPVIHAA